MKYLKLFFVTVVTLNLLHSCNFLDVDDYFQETLKYDSIFQTKRNIEKYLWGTVAYFPDEGAIFGNNYTPGPFATDEGFTLFGTSEFRGMAFVLGEVTPDNLYNMNIWDNMYRIVRKANTVLARVDEAKDLTNLDKREIVGYAYFMRAYAYYLLLMQYGPVVILGDDVLETNMEPEYYDRARATYDESVEYICGELERAASYIPDKVPASFFGRPTQGAAYALIARIRLHSASPLFNGQNAAKTYFGSWKRSVDGVNYISQTYDERKWAVAAYASKRIIDKGTYHLHTVTKLDDSFKIPDNVSSLPFPDGAGDIDPFRSYSDMFTGEVLAVNNPEIIWGANSSSLLTYTQRSFPFTLAGYNGMSVTQKMIDAFYMADGRTINNSSAEYPYVANNPDESVGSDKTFSGYILKGSASKRYANREMRFYANIGFSECYWTASTGDLVNRTITYYNGLSSNDGQAAIAAGGNVNNYPITGYVIKKYIHPDDAWRGDNARRVGKSFPIIRYAEILLSYVEALNNLTTTHSVTDSAGGVHTFQRDPAQIRYYFNQVRYRVGLPGMTEEESNSAEKVQELIEKERMIEFLFENRRYFDVRRWGIYETTEKEPFQGMDTSTGKAGYYNVVPINHSRARNRIIDKRMVFMPISRAEIRKAEKLDQNYGWPD